VKVTSFALKVSLPERLATTPTLDGCVPMTSAGLAPEESLNRLTATFPYTTVESDYKDVSKVV
jgi:hypothetical protein